MASETEPKTFTFQHPELGKLTGLITPENVVQFRAIPYATIPARFQQSVLNDGLLDGDGDFTQHGYACPQLATTPEVGGGPLPGQTIPHPEDEFKCLIIQVNVPLSCLTSSSTLSLLPVLIYIHGGGFVLGKIDEQHNTSLIVQQSLFDSQPIVSVSIQYRLGALGYLHTSPEQSNLALNDQRNALLWIQKFIGGFGGDKSRITAFGESGGAMSICAQILAPPPVTGPLFRRAILMSGVLGPSVAPASWEDARGTYKRVLKELEIEGEGDTDEALRQLREVSVERIVEASKRMGDGGAMWLSVRDERFFGEKAGDLTWDRIPEYIGRVEWLEEFVMGTTSFEGTMFMDLVRGVTPQDFLDGVSALSGHEIASRIAEIYEISPSMDQNLFYTRMMRWAGDMAFDIPHHILARRLTEHTTKKVYRYNFDVRNPFPNNPFYQQPHHWVDKYFVFKVHQCRFPNQRLKDISSRHAQMWIDFANGKAPWKEFTYSGKGDEIIMVADEREGWVERSVSENERVSGMSWKRCEDMAETWAGEKGKNFNPFSMECLGGKRLT